MVAKPCHGLTTNVIYKKSVLVCEILPGRGVSTSPRISILKMKHQKTSTKTKKESVY